VFIFAIIRMIYKDIRGMVQQEEYVAAQSAPILRVIGYRDNSYHGPRNDYPLSKSKIVIGRTKSCDIMVEDMLVSNKHVSLWFEDNEWHIRDLKSRNGTWLNGTRIEEPYLLDDGDVIRVGEMELEFKV
jgi:pSer/pThr/pTyr-binding forkhead associated (FHA) protein